MVHKESSGLKFSTNQNHCQTDFLSSVFPSGWLNMFLSNSTSDFYDLDTLLHQNQYSLICKILFSNRSPDAIMCGRRLISLSSSLVTWTLHSIPKSIIILVNTSALSFILKAGFLRSSSFFLGFSVKEIAPKQKLTP